MQPLRIKLCFLLDCTGSMGPWIQAAKTQSEAIVERTQKEHRDIDLRIQVAFVGYRDYGDEVRYEIVPFTTVEEFLERIRPVTAEGGDDLAEDVAGGLEKVLDLNWDRADVRTLIHIADAPPHGVAYHAPHVSDRFPDGDPRGIDLRLLLHSLAETIDMTFISINSSTNLYCSTALSAYRSIGRHTFSVADLRPQDTHLLTPITSQAMNDSIQRYTASQDPEGA